jgi:iron complex outermembrane receptor protein
MKTRFSGASLLAITAAMAAASAASAQTATVDEGIEAVIVTGTRTSGLRAVDSPAPVQVLGNDLLLRTGQPNLIQALAQNVPSIQAQAFGSDTAAFNLAFKLRGLSPNHTLVLVNGKRRHGMANVAVSGGAYGGNAAADISLIPMASVDHIEVLQEGAAAQYGTDAIAGVVNIFLKKKTSGGQIQVSGGEYMDGGGRTGEVSLNLAMAPIENSYLDMTLSTKYHGFSFRGDVDPRVMANTAAGATALAQYPLLASNPDYPYVNRISGDAESRQTNFLFNGGYDFTDDLQFYTFGTYGYRWGQAYENYRPPSVILGAMPNRGDVLYPQGFSPKENLVQTEYAITGGFSGKFGDWNWDLSTTYGHDKNVINVLQSGNLSRYLDSSTATTKGSTQTDFHDGDFVSSQWTNTLDVTREFDVGFTKPLNFAAGAEYRRDMYELVAGDPDSYYKTGAQSFFGYAPSNAGKHKRNNKAAYVDLAFEPVDALKLDLAARYEDYSDFGDTLVFKGTARYDFNPMIAIRGTASTGFRAPTLGEGFYSGINVGPTSVSGVFAPNSAGAKFLGINGLGPEKSTNFSGGFVAHPISRLTVTLDAYSIKIKNRILQSGTLTGYNANPAVIRSPSVITALVTNGVVIDPAIFTAPSASVGVNVFVNGLDTLTQGADFVATYSTNFDTLGKFDWSLSANYNSTTIKKVAPPPSNVAQSVVLFDVNAQSLIKTATPKWRATAGMVWTLGIFSVNVRESFYGGSFTYAQKPIGAGFDRIAISAKGITDLEGAVEVLKGVRVAIGANNLFNVYPDKNPAEYRAAQYSTTASGYASQYPGTSPFGINGGYYYGRVTVNF